MSLLQNIVVALFSPSRSRRQHIDPLDLLSSPDMLGASLDFDFAEHREHNRREWEAKERQRAQKREEIVEFLRKGAQKSRELAGKEVLLDSTKGQSHAAFTAALTALRERDAEAWQAIVELATHLYGADPTRKVLREEFDQVWIIHLTGAARRIS